MTDPSREQRIAELNARAHNIRAAIPTRDEVSRYERLSPLARALVDDYDALDLAEMLVKTQDELAALRAVAALDAPLRDQLRAAIKALGKSETELAGLRGQLADTARSRDEWKWRAEDAGRGTRCQRERADEAEERLRRIATGHPRADAIQAEIGEMIAQTHELRDQLRAAEAVVARIQALDQPALAATEATDTQEQP